MNKLFTIILSIFWTLLTGIIVYANYYHVGVLAILTFGMGILFGEMIVDLKHTFFPKTHRISNIKTSEGYFKNLIDYERHIKKKYALEGKEE